MVLSPIEPVAPSTVTVRTADAAALLLRNGTALICSPNHKTAADAIHAAPQKPENRGKYHRRHEAVEAVHQPAMAGNEVARILDAETPLYRGLQEIAKLGRDRECRAEQQYGACFGKAKRRKSSRYGQAHEKAAGSARPGLLWTSPQPEFRPAEGASGEEAADIGRPNHEQDQHQRDEEI